jgi:hypothetical protein
MENKKVDIKAFYTDRPDILKFVTEFYYKDFLELKYPMKLAVTPFAHVMPNFDSKLKYDSDHIRNNPNDIYYWAMKSVYNQEQEPKDSDMVIFEGASGPEPPEQI